MLEYLSLQEIENCAISFLKEHCSFPSLPIPIEEIIDLKLGLNIIPIPGLFNLHNIDAFLSADLKNLYIDHDHLEYRYSRARYSFAHEVGHLILHRHYLDNLKIDSLEIWKEIVLGKGTGHAMFETQANIFASFLLMPQSHIEREFEKIKTELKVHSFYKEAKFLDDDMSLATFVAGKIGRIFDVSEEAAHYRLINWVNFKLKK
jgi:Zn-dependent peptidase ImmA (M78 family)